MLKFFKSNKSCVLGVGVVCRTASRGVPATETEEERMSVTWQILS